MITTEAWVLHNLHTDAARPAGLQRECIAFENIEADEVLVEPLYGCWEGNMGHAVARRPIDVAHYRGEDRVVIGNAGVVRILQPGSSVRNVREGDLCLLIAAIWDKNGFICGVTGYDAKGTFGLLAKRTKVRADQLVRIPADTRFPLQRWAAFSVRYFTAWANWRVASQCWNAIKPTTPGFEPHVWGWGGGTTFAEVSLARLAGFRTAMISAVPERLRLIEAAGITPVDRAEFRDLRYDERRIASDEVYADKYKRAEDRFLQTVKQHTAGNGVSIFVDQIGAAVTPATVKALSRPGVLTTSGWKSGMKLSNNRAMAAMNWHTHVHTHAGRLEDCEPSVTFAEQHGWLAPVDDCVRGWDEIPQLADDYEAGKITSYFPLYQVNPV